MNDHVDSSTVETANDRLSTPGIRSIVTLLRGRAGLRCLIAVTLSACLASQSASADAPIGPVNPASRPNAKTDSTTVKIPKSVATHLESYCVDCHGADPEDVSGGFDILQRVEQLTLKDADEAVAIIEAIETRRMPPQDAAQPAHDDRAQVLDELEANLHANLKGQSKPPTASIRRMNRFQYNNAVTDLFQLNCLVFTLPEKIMREHGRYFDPSSGVMPDQVSVGNRPLGKSQMIEPRLAGVAAFPQDLRAEHGYDNQTDHLSMSPLLMEAFLQLGNSITNSPDFNPKRVGIWSTFFAPPEDGEEAMQRVEEILPPFLNLAFRGRVTDPLIDRYKNYARRKLDEGKSFTATMKDVAAAIISSPRFYYLYTPELKTDQGAQSEPSAQIDSLELASRLSLFLWGSIPDTEMLTAAKSGRLLTPEGLDEQITRMLLDRKLKRFCDSFPSQWLQLERLISSIPNRELYPDFYFSKYRRSMHMMLEPLLLFETVLVENRSILELIDPTFSYRSPLLETAYGELKSAAGQLPGGGGQVTSLTFSRVPIADRRSGGVITNAAVMTMTSGPERTQPITRGAWVAGVIFNDPPNPPPADVPPLQENANPKDVHQTLREQLDAHRERSDCRGCHEQIDPLGFALENYDAVGKWRATYANGLEIDASGTIFNQNHYVDPTQFKDAILEQKHRFSRALTEHIAAFALGRKMTVHDRQELQTIAQELKENDYQLQALIRAIAHSTLFRSN